MNRINAPVVVLVFLAEIVADVILQSLLFVLYAGSAINDSMSNAEIKAVTDVIAGTTGFLLISAVRGTATTIAGGFFVAKYARKFPYYNGLAIGILGFVLCVVLWGDGPLWFNLLGVLTTLPAALYGAHLAKKHAANRE